MYLPCRALSGASQRSAQAEPWNPVTPVDTAASPILEIKEKATKGKAREPAPTWIAEKSEGQDQSDWPPFKHCK